MMTLQRTLRVLKQLSSVLDSGPGIDDALLVGDIALVVRVLRGEIERLPDAEIEPTLSLALSKLYQEIGDEVRCLSMFQRAASFSDQNRGFYSDLGFWAVQLSKESPSKEFSKELKQATERLLSICPFREDLLAALGRTA